MFLGQHTGKIKQNNRLPLPAGFNMQLSGGVYITQGFDRNALVLPKQVFENLYRHISSLNIADPQARLLLRMFFGTAAYIEPGKDGTLSIPKGLVQFADLFNAVVLVGQGDYFEVWSTDQWAQQEIQLKDFQANAQRFSAFTIATR